jgi:hypothetical protein
MKRHLVCGLLLMVTFVFCKGDDLPPKQLLEENTKKAAAIIQGDITASEMPKGQLAATTLSITKVFRGPFHKGDSLTYYSFKEQASYADAWRGKTIVVYLAKRTDSAGVSKWYTATDLAEFIYSDQLEKIIVSLLQRQK